MNRLMLVLMLGLVAMATPGVAGASFWDDLEKVISDYEIFNNNG